MNTGQEKRVNCPICAKSSIDIFRPFCSDRCKMIDLGRWFYGDYKVPVSISDEHIEGEYGEEESLES